ncbi:bifunctional glycosyltransferase family 2/GtrA family protein [Sinomonas sp. ASV486]|uniref:dolichyl-phosphate beta-glucosyltransferase n=1 Tax=Sinomonas puerhi TaxID=3238584 RepID=A0AB39L1U3_9MICC|nr:bifunctional glycosyltransferase family 2/GtrA family protein [Sinomonas sp. ASV486]MDQ4488807.1 bifunctional glycosyltransferase family 2/GtrA family protein [Sinomonas sp. ASV486]
MTEVHGGPAIDIVVPVHNEEDALAGSVTSLVAYLEEAFQIPWVVTIADNASTDGTRAIGESLAAQLEGVRYLRLETKGRGFALRQAWMESTAKVVAYLDVDLSTDLAALPPLIAPLLSGHSDMSIGTRLGRTARVVRGPKREIISRTYNVMLKGTLGVRFSDAQCGFKALRADVARTLLPHVEDNAWFFDTELLVLAERAGLRIHEIPVDWTDDPTSTVDIAQTAMDDMRGIVRVAKSLALGRIPLAAIYAELGRRPLLPVRPPSFFGQVLRFGAVGVASTIAYAVLYLMLQPLMGAQPANFSALLITAVLNTAANRRFTFGISGPAHYGVQQFQGLIVFGLAWGLTSSSLVVLHALNTDPGATAELVTLTAANVVATVMRFALLKAWVFRRRTTAGGRVRADTASARAMDAA